jgi:hypothetical protein
MKKKFLEFVESSTSRKILLILNILVALLFAWEHNYMFIVNIIWILPIVCNIKGKESN